MKSASRFVSKSLAMITMLGVAAVGCVGEEPENGGGERHYERPDEAEDIVSDEYLQRLEDEGDMVIHDGDDPPTIEGEYYFGDAEVVYTDSENWPSSGDSCHHYTTYEPTDSPYRYEMSGESPDCDGAGVGEAAFISGSGDCFTLYIAAEGHFEDCETEEASVMSACLADNGDLEDPLTGGIALNREGECSVIDQGRLKAEDEISVTRQADGVAEKVE